MPTVEQIADAIDQRLAEAGRQLASLQAARAALVQTSSSRATDGAARRAAPRSRARRSANSSSDTRQGSRTGSRNGRRKSQAPASPEVAGSGSSASPTATRGAGAAEPRGRRRSRTQPQSAAGATTPPARRSAPRPQRNGDRAATAAPQSSRRRARDLEPAKIEELLRASTDGLSLAALAKELGVGAAKVRTQLNELHRTGKVRSEGSRRTSRWRLVTDEERIAARVAELERAQTSSNSSD